jgi:superfamily II DNA/RNA helicase
MVQWKLPEKLSTFIQRAGRVARGPDQKGIAVLLTEPSAYSVSLNSPEDNNSKESKSKRGQGRKSSSSKKATKEKDYARQHGRFRGDRMCHDALTPLPQGQSVDDNDPTEGLYHFVQATNCRRGVVTDVFNNPDSSEHPISDSVLIA